MARAGSLENVGFIKKFLSFKVLMVFSFSFLVLVYEEDQAQNYDPGRTSYAQWNDICSVDDVTSKLKIRD